MAKNTSTPTNPPGSAAGHRWQTTTSADGERAQRLDLRPDAGRRRAFGGTGGGRLVVVRPQRRGERSGAGRDTGDRHGATVPTHPRPHIGQSPDLRT